MKASSEPAQKAGFKSALEIVSPTSRVLNLLKRHEAELIPPKSGWFVHPYYISALEIVRDTAHLSRHEADVTTRRLSETLRMKWSSTKYKGDPFSDLDKYADVRSRGKGLFSFQSWYYGGKQFSFVMYARDSKINGKPSVHQEWRINGASMIKKKTGISSIEDLISCDIKELFESLYEQYITHERIDKEKLGRFILDWDGRRKFSEEQRAAARFQGATFCRVNEIENSADLLKFIRKMKADIRAKRGRKYRREVRWLKVSPRKFLVAVKE